MKILKTILQSRLFCVFLIIITSLITVFRIAIKPKLYYTEQDKEVIGVIEKITRDNKKITMLIKAKEKLQGFARRFSRYRRCRSRPGAGETSGLRPVDYRQTPSPSECFRSDEYHRERRRQKLRDYG